MQEYNKGSGSSKKAGGLENGTQPLRKSNVVDATDAVDAAETIAPRSTLWKKDAQRKTDANDNLFTHDATDAATIETRVADAATTLDTPKDTVETADQTAIVEARDVRDVDVPNAGADLDRDVVLDAERSHDRADDSADDNTRADYGDVIEQPASERDQAEETRAAYLASSEHRSSEGVSLKTPLLAIAAAVGLLAAAWNYTALVDTRAQLSAVTEAKATVDRQLADAQSRLSAAETAVANVKAALTAAPASTAAPAAPADAEKTAAP